MLTVPPDGPTTAELGGRTILPKTLVEVPSGPDEPEIVA